MYIICVLHIYTYMYIYTHLAPLTRMHPIVKSGCFVTTDPAQHRGSIEFCNKREKHVSLMQVVKISSSAGSSPRAMKRRERKVGGKEEHFLLSRAYGGLQHRCITTFCFHPLSLFAIPPASPRLYNDDLELFLFIDKRLYISLCKEK